LIENQKFFKYFNEDNNMSKISIIGPINIDLIIKGSAPVDANELKKWVGPSNIYYITAGAAGYISQNLYKLGNEIHLVSCVGDDIFGDMIISSFKKRGINTRYIIKEKGTEGAMAIFILLFGDNKRPFTYRLPTHHGWPPKLSNKFKKYLLDVDLLHSSGYLHFPDLWTDELPNLFKTARQKGIKTSLDPQFPLTPMKQPWINVLKPLLAHVDILMVDENEALNITGKNSIEDASESLFKEGPKTVAIKLGDKGVLVKDDKKMVQIPAILPAKFVDTIGAGDSFDAGFLQGLLEKKNIEEAAKIGVFTASKSIEGVGGTEMFPSRIEIKL
jgi:sugar/nucleoside kinase (ribokinase family)